MLPRHPVKKKIADFAGGTGTGGEKAAADGIRPSDSREAGLEAKAAALASSPGAGAVEEPTPGKQGQSDLARHRARQEEIQKLVNQLPGRIREQMDDLFRARFTHIQELDQVQGDPDA